MSINRDFADLARSSQPGKNLVQNGNFTVAQRGTVTSPASGAYLTDRWKNWQTTGGAVTITQDTSGVFAAFGTDTAMKIDVTTAESSVASGDRFVVAQPIEAQNLQHLKYGLAGAEAITISFCFRSPKSGTHYVAIYQADADRYIWRPFTVTSADTAEQFSLTFAADTGGTINNDTGIGLFLYFPLMAGSSFEGGSDNTWASGEKYGAATIQNLLDNTSNNIYIGLVQLEVGSVATDFAHEDYGTTLLKCKRYFERWSFAANKYFTVGHCYSTTAAVSNLDCQVVKRAAPTITIATAGGGDFLTGGGFTAWTTSSFDDITPEGGRIFMECSSGLGQDEATHCRVDLNNPIDFSSEL
jgi:hypothetical protein